MVSGENFIPDRGDLIWLDFHPQAGREQTGRRPGLVLSPGSHHARVGLADHVRSVDWRRRRAEPVGKASPDLLEAVIQRVEVLIRPEDRRR